MSLNNKREKGYFFEKITSDWLKKKGYKIIAQNYQAGHTEIDIVAEIKDMLCIVEVKYRKIKNEQDQNMAYHSVGVKKQQNLIRATKIFLARNPKYLNYFQRFDVFLIMNNGISQKVNHIIDAFREQ